MRQCNPAARGRLSSPAHLTTWPLPRCILLSVCHIDDSSLEIDIVIKQLGISVFCVVPGSPIYLCLSPFLPVQVVIWTPACPSRISWAILVLSAWPSLHTSRAYSRLFVRWSTFTRTSSLLTLRNLSRNGARSRLSNDVTFVNLTLYYVVC